MRALILAIGVGIATLYLAVAVRYCIDIIRWLPGRERWGRSIKGLCPACGYDLTGNVSGTCPECGSKISPRPENLKFPLSPSLVTETQPWWVWAIVAMSMILAVILQRLAWG